MFWFILPPALTAVIALFLPNYTMAVNAAVTVACLIVFGVLQCKYQFLPHPTAYALQGFILLALWVGKALRGYDTLPAWDTLLHFLSGGLLVSMGATVYRRCRGDTHNLRLFRLFALFFSLAGAGLWEVYEFALDQLFHMASQNNSLADTMWDMVAGTVSATAAIFCIKKSSG